MNPCESTTNFATNIVFFEKMGSKPPSNEVLPEKPSKELRSLSTSISSSSKYTDPGDVKTRDKTIMSKPLSKFEILGYDTDAESSGSIDIEECKNKSDDLDDNKEFNSDEDQDDLKVECLEVLDNGLNQNSPQTPIFDDISPPKIENKEAIVPSRNDDVEDESTDVSIDVLVEYVKLVNLLIYVCLFVAVFVWCVFIPYYLFSPYCFTPNDDGDDDLKPIYFKPFHEYGLNERFLIKLDPLDDAPLMQSEIKRLKSKMDTILGDLERKVDFKLLCGYEFLTGPPITDLDGILKMNANITDQCAMYLPEYSYLKQPYFMFNNLKLNENKVKKVNKGEVTSKTHLMDAKLAFIFDYWEYCRVKDSEGTRKERKSQYHVILNHTANILNDKKVMDVMGSLDLLMQSPSDDGRLMSIPAILYAHGEITGNPRNDLNFLNFVMVYDIANEIDGNKKGINEKVMGSVRIPNSLIFALNTVEEEQNLKKPWCL